MQHIDRSIHIPIQHQAAVWASVCARGECLFDDAAAVRARLASVSRVHFFDQPTSFCRFVGETVDERAPCCVIDGLGQHPASHALDTEVFDYDAVVLVYQLAALSVREVLALVSYLAVVFRQPLDCVATAVTALLLASHAALQHAQFLLPVLVELRQRHGISVASCDKVIEAEVDTDHPGVGELGWQHIGQLDGEVDLPDTAIARHGSCLDLASLRHIPMPAHLDAAGDADNTQTIAVDAQSVAVLKLDGIPAGTGLEAREAGRVATLDARKERFEGFIESAQHLLLGRVAELLELCVIGTERFKLPCLIVVVQRMPFAVGVDTLFKRTVVQAAKTPQHFGQFFFLSGIGVQPVLVSLEHSVALLILDVSLDSGRADDSYRPGVIAPAPQGWQAALQVRELGTQYPTARALQPVGHTGNTPARIALNEQVNMVRHDFERVDSPLLFITDLSQHIFKAHRDIADQYGAAILRAPHDVIFEAKHSPGILGVSRHTADYTVARYITAVKLNYGAATPSPRQLKLTAPLPNFYG